MWAILALAQLGQTQKAADLFALVNPINHARTEQEAARYKVEPYVVAADVYSVAPHVGRGGWTWYTGSAGWMYRAGLEGILGLARERGCLTLNPRLPENWPGFECALTSEGTRYNIKVVRVNSCSSISIVSVDGVGVDMKQGMIRLPLDGGLHTVHMQICS